MAIMTPLINSKLQSLRLFFGLGLTIAPSLLSLPAIAQPAVHSRIAQRPAVVDTWLLCPAGESLARQTAIDTLIAHAAQQFDRGGVTQALSDLDRALKLTQDSKSSKTSHRSLDYLLSSGPLQSALTNGPHRIQRLDRLSQLINQVDDPFVRAGFLLKVAKGYQTAQSPAKAIALVDRVSGLLKPDSPLGVNLPILLDAVELYLALNRPDRARPLVDRMANELKAAERQLAKEQLGSLDSFYEPVTRGYALLGLPQLVAPLLKSVQSWESKLAANVNLAIAYANAKQTAKANQHFIETIAASINVSEQQAAYRILQYAQANQWTAAIQATQRLKTPQLKAKIRLDIGSLYAKAGQFDRAVEMGKLAASHAQEAGSFSIGRDDVIQWLTQWQYFDRGTPEVIGVVEALELYVYDEVVTAVLQGARKNQQPKVVDRALGWLKQGSFINATVEAMLIYAERRQVSQAFQMLKMGGDPYRNLAILAHYFYQIKQPQNADRARTSALGLLSTQTFGDPSELTKASLAIASMELSAGRTKNAVTAATQTINNAKSKLSATAFLELAQSLVEQLIVTGHPEFVPIVVNAVAPGDRPRLHEVLYATLATSRSSQSLVYSRLPVDAMMQAWVVALKLPPEDTANKLLEIARLQTEKSRSNEIRITLNQMLLAIAKMNPVGQTNLLKDALPLIVATGDAKLLAAAIAMIPAPAERQVAQETAGCLQ